MPLRFNKVLAVFLEGVDRWSGCNWPTSYGSLGMNLDGVPASLARRFAKRWAALAVDENTTAPVTAEEESTIFQMAWHLQQTSATTSDTRACPRRLARIRCATALSQEWAIAAHFLSEIEQDANDAQQEAAQAIQAASKNDWPTARWHACRACSIESGYIAPRAWRRLKLTIERAIRS